MTLVLNLGVADLPYASEHGATTGDVAGWLENKYHPIRIFYQINEDRIATLLGESVGTALENLLMGAPRAADPYASAVSQIEADFRHFLSAKVLESLGYPGMPTQAAIQGVNHRLKQKKGPRRPSLIDTGLYQASFRAWTSGSFDAVATASAQPAA